MNERGELLDRQAAKAFAGQRVLLTGASGFLGHQVSRQGLAASVEVHALGRSTAPAGVTFHQADLRDIEAVRGAVHSCSPSAVIHCAAPGVVYGSTELREMLEVTVRGTEALYSACAELAVPPIVVHVGSGFEYASATAPVDEDWPLVPSGSLYGAAKAAGASVAGAFADRLRVVLVRPFHIYGAGEAARRLGPYIVAEARAGREVALTAGEQRRDFLHVDDCAGCLWRALTLAPPRTDVAVYNLGSGTASTLRIFVELLGTALSARGVALKAMFGALPYRANEPMVSLPNIQRWRELSGWAAAIPLERGVADLVDAELRR